MWGFNLSDELENLMSEGTLCDEWLGEIRLHGVLATNALVGKITGIKGIATGKPYKNWNKDDIKKYDEFIKPVEDSLYLELHYIPKIDCWQINIEGREHLVSRRMLGWRSNERLFSKEVFTKDDERLAIEVYERDFVHDKEKLLSGPRLAFCLIYSKGLGIENQKDGSFLIAEYPLPEKLSLSATSESIRASFQRNEERLEKLGWKIIQEAVRDPSGQDYFGEYWLYESPAQYENKGVVIEKMI